MLTLIAGAAEVHQADWNSGSGRDALGHTHIDLVQSEKSGRVSEEQDFRRPATDENLRRNDAAVDQSGHEDFERLSGGGRHVLRNDLLCGRVQDCRFSSLVR
jgi:hypothetical protein